MTSSLSGLRRACTLAASVLVLSGPGAAAQAPRPGVDWPQFRGAQASGVAEGFEAPVRWNAETGENIRWTTPIPGLGHSSPIVWGDLVCVTTADSGEDDELKVGLYGDIESVANDQPQRWEVRCLDKGTGGERWTAVAHQGVPARARHPKSSHASSTLATDGIHLVAMFGSEGLFAYELDTGRELWTVDLGVLGSGYFRAPTALWGFAASPVIHDGLVVIQADILRGSFLAAFDVATGDERWRVDRDDVPTWSTPTVHVVNGRAQIVVNGFRHIGGYDLKTGDELWRMVGRHHTTHRHPLERRPRLEPAPRRRLHADPNRVRRDPVQLSGQRRAQCLRAAHRPPALSGADRRWRFRIHRVAGGGRRQAVLQQ